MTESIVNKALAKFKEYDLKGMQEVFGIICDDGVFVADEHECGICGLAVLMIGLSCRSADGSEISPDSSAAFAMLGISRSFAAGYISGFDGGCKPAAREMAVSTFSLTAEYLVPEEFNQGFDEGKATWDELVSDRRAVVTI